jgi:hypothetical protein
VARPHDDDDDDDDDDGDGHDAGSAQRLARARQRLTWAMGSLRQRRGGGESVLFVLAPDLLEECAVVQMGRLPAPQMPFVRRCRAGGSGGGGGSSSSDTQDIKHQRR